MGDIKIGYEDDVTGALSTTKGSDGRLNVSSRTDSRGYYISRDQKQSYSWVFDHTAAAAGQYSFYLQNTSATLELVISHIGINSDLGTNCKLWFTTGAAANGTTMTGTNTHGGVGVAAANGLQDGGGTPISGFTLDKIIDFVKVPIEGHEELRLDDRIRLSQNQGLTLEVDAVTSGTPQSFGVVFGYFE